MELRQKEVVNLSDGKRLGRVCDVVFTYPEGKVQGIVVPGGRGFRFGKPDLFIDLKDIQKIGMDVILVEIKCAPPKKLDKKCRWGEPTRPHSEENYCKNNANNRRDYGEYE